MNATTTISYIDSATPIVVSVNEYTSGLVSKAYSQNIAILKEILDRTAANPIYNGNPPPLTAQDALNARDAILALDALATNGITQSANFADPNDMTQPQVTYYMTLAMGTTLDAVVKSLKAAGFTTTSYDLSALQTWQSLAGFGIESLIQAAVNAGGSSSTRSLQSMVELEYVTQANEVIFGNLSSLQTALSNTSSILGLLQIMQNIQNRITVSKPISGAFSTFSKYFANRLQAATISLGTPGVPKPVSQLSPQIYADIYKTAANQYFGTPIVQTTLSRGTTTFSIVGINPISFQPITVATYHPSADEVNTANQIISAKQTLLKQIAKLEALNPAASRSVPNTLAFALNTLVTAINTTFAGLSLGSPAINKASAISAWIIDGRSDVTNTGKIQSNITQAISSAQSLNDTQKQNVSQYMFLFEEFYKSASAILTQITQIIQKMAQGIK